MSTGLKLGGLCLVLVLFACARHTAWTVVYAGNDKANGVYGAMDKLLNCNKFVANGGGNEFVVVDVKSGHKPMIDAKLSGDFGGFGPRQLRNESSADSFQGDLVYRVGTLKGARAEVDSGGCE